MFYYAYGEKEYAYVLYIYKASTILLTNRVPDCDR